MPNNTKVECNTRLMCGLGMFTRVLASNEYRRV